MLRNRSRRTVTSKQASLMADQPASSSSSKTHIGHFTKPTPTLFIISPKFKLFTTKITPFDSDFALISPTSILDANPSIFSPKTDKPTIPKPQRFQPPEPFGLADLVKTAKSDDIGEIDRENEGNSSKPVNKMVLFASKIRAQIPTADFGTKGKGPSYPGQGQGSPCVQTRVLSGCSSRIPVRKMEQSEDYTCVISHGPNPTTTHIFDNCVFVESTSPVSSAPPPHDCSRTDSFLSFCYTCKKILDQDHDIYIYRGEKAFCSSECRYEEMLIDQMEN